MRTHHARGLLTTGHIAGTVENDESESGELTLNLKGNALNKYLQVVGSSEAKIRI
jgi:hypothetical protein